MDGNRMLQQVTAIFTTVMVLFYLGMGIYLLFYYNLTPIEKPLRVILGSALIFYGLYRGFRAYVRIIEVFFKKDKNED